MLVKNDIIFNTISGIVADQVVNTMLLQTATEPGTPAEITDQVVFISSFYNNNGAVSGKSIANYLGSMLSRASQAVTVKQYDVSGHLDGSAHGSPINVGHFTLQPPTAGFLDLPEEVAVVLSYHSLLTNIPQEGPGVIRPAARHRGRIYIGPLTSAAVSSDATTHQTVVAPTLRQTLVDASTALLALPDAQWMQWSRTSALATSVHGGFIDDSFDTMRKRGPKARSRSQWGSAG